MPNDNPVVVQAAWVTGVIIVVKTLITYFRVMGWIELPEEKFQATISVFETLIPIVAVWGGVLWARRKVTSLTNPTDVDGTPLTRPDNTPSIPQMEKQQVEAIELNKKIDERSIVRP